MNSLTFLRLKNAFYPKIMQGNSELDCWSWIGAKSNNGYGQITAMWEGESITKSAHRFSYELHIGPIPEEMYVLHKCDNSECCNPLHLFLGTHLDNMRDRNTKGRAAKGIAHGTAKLSEEQVLEIYSRKGYETSRDLAKRFSVNQATISRIWVKKNWTHITNNSSVGAS